MKKQTSLDENDGRSRRKRHQKFQKSSTLPVIPDEIPWVFELGKGPQQVNKVAHLLAQFGLRKGHSFVWTDAAPPWLVPALELDRHAI
ncbi:hypothetical protein L3X38_024652 [Prunus dulcis]|uniref:Uncharacterized protein n=1 Tax=Prunus dulcis TaxID=3755 RepID=A0AAD4W1T8_PRUDU|nr:hypothetical protein L3X38_024652 [Prunus dulcis]